MSTSTKGLTANTTLTLSKKGAAYKPRSNSVQGNAASWEILQGALAKPQTYGSLQKLLAENRNHANFVGYAVRRGWLVAK